MLAGLFRRMPFITGRSIAQQRTDIIRRHMSSATGTTESPVVFEENLSVRTYKLNRPKKLNALDDEMLNILRPNIEAWSRSELCQIVVGRGEGRAFCAGGNVRAVIEQISDIKQRPNAINFFKREFEMDYILASMQKPYVVICDGMTMGGGLGLAAPAEFRIATENSLFAMPETKIGYCPDVGANYFLSRLDGEIGTYLALTGNTLTGQAAFEHGLATHFVPSNRIPHLLDSLSSLERPIADDKDMHTFFNKINALIEIHSDYQQSEDGIKGDKRAALDLAFSHNSVKEIFDALQKLSTRMDPVGTWAQTTLSDLEMRSPTSLVVALEAIRRGKRLNLLQAIQMELGIATAYCNGASTDFRTGVAAVVIEKSKLRPKWSPASISELSEKEIIKSFFEPDSPYLKQTPPLFDYEHDFEFVNKDTKRFALPSEVEIEQMVRGSHTSSASTAPNFQDLIASFEQLRGEKNGLREKVSEVVSRRCNAIRANDGAEYLRWK